MTTSTKSASKTPAKKSTVKKSAQKADNCWPGYKPVAGKKAGEKGSCEKKTAQTKTEKRADGRAAAASKLQKAGGSKAKANKSEQ